MGEAKAHHRIPQTYMRSWGDNVWIYDKEKDLSEQRNVDSILKMNFFHSIKAGSVFQTPESLNKIFKSLETYKISFIEDGNKIELNSKEKTEDA